MRLRDRSSLRAPKRFEGTVSPGQLGSRESQQPRSRTGTPASTTQEESQQQQPSSSPSTPTAMPPRKERQSRRVIMPASARPKHPMTYVDYDPNLPPAKFPTLDVPVPSGEVAATTAEGENVDASDGEDQGEPMEGVVGATGEPIESEDEDDADCETENTKEMMESSDEEEADDAHDDNEEATTPFKVPENVVWADIRPRLQGEIMCNMAAECDGWHEVMFTLGLTLKERREAIDTLGYRDRQLTRELTNLELMQTKQRRALLRIDYSERKELAAPEELIFNSLSKEYLRRRQSQTSPDADFFMSKASDVLVARQFLRQRGLDVKFAGEWTNDFVKFKDDGDQDRLEWIHDESFGATGRGIEQDTVAQLGVKKSRRTFPHKHPNNNPDLSRKVGLINQFSDNSAPGQPSTGNNMPPVRLNVARHLFRRRRTEGRRRRDPPAQTSNAAPTAPARREGVVRLRIGPQGAAKIQQGRSSAVAASSTSQPQSFHAPQRPTPLRTSSKAATVAARNTNPVAAGNPRAAASTPRLPAGQSSARKVHKLPARRVLAGAWWYDSGSNQSERSTSFAVNLAGRLLETRAETELRRLTHEQTIRNQAEAVKIEETFKNKLPFRTTQYRYEGDPGIAVEPAFLPEEVERRFGIPHPEDMEHEQPSGESVDAGTKEKPTDDAQPAESPNLKISGASDMIMEPVSDSFLQELGVTTPLAERQRPGYDVSCTDPNSAVDKAKPTEGQGEPQTNTNLDASIVKSADNVPAAEVVQNKDDKMEEDPKTDTAVIVDVAITKPEDDSHAAEATPNKDEEVKGGIKICDSVHEDAVVTGTEVQPEETEVISKKSEESCQESKADADATLVKSVGDTQTAAAAQPDEVGYPVPNGPKVTQPSSGPAARGGGVRYYRGGRAVAMASRGCPMVMPHARTSPKPTEAQAKRTAEASAKDTAAAPQGEKDEPATKKLKPTKKGGSARKAVSASGARRSIRLIGTRKLRPRTSTDASEKKK